MFSQNLVLVDVKPRIFGKSICKTLEKKTEPWIGDANIVGSRKMSIKTQFYSNSVGR